MTRILWILAASGTLFAQDAPLVRFQHEVARIKALPSTASDDARSVAPLHAALRAWIEARLPADRGLLEGGYGHLAADLERELNEARLSEGEPPADPGLAFDGPGIGFASVELERKPELPDILFVTAGVSIPCGYEDSVYAYQFDAAGRRLVFADHPKEDRYGSAEIELAEPDREGRRLVLVHRTTQQCSSTWMGLTYSVYRLGVLPGPAKALISGQHSFWMTMDSPIYVLKPGELIMEFRDSSVDSGIHNRTQVIRYRFDDAARRIDPVALQPQDFAEEWLTRPWSEMESRSAPDTAEWHQKLHADFELGDYERVVPCAQRPDRWMIGLAVKFIGEKEFKNPVEAFFLVHDLGGYRYAMEGVSAKLFEGCPGPGLQSDSGPASDKHPLLTESELKALPVE